MGFKRSNKNYGQTSDENYLFNNRTSYSPPTNSDIESSENLLSAPLTTMEQRVQTSEDLLRETQALCADTEQIGSATLETMGRQLEQIERSGNLIHQSIADTEQARQIMKEMSRRALKNKIFLYCVIALLVLANGAAMIYLWRRKK